MERDAIIAALERALEVNRRLIAAAASGSGRQGLADALHGLTGLPVAIEDRWGNLSAWAGANRPDPYPKSPRAERDELIWRLGRGTEPLRDQDRWLSLASHPSGATAVVALVDAAGNAGPLELSALMETTTMLAIEVGHLQSLQEAQAGLQRDLVDDLLSGTDDQNALARATALGHDLLAAHRVVIVRDPVRVGHHDRFTTAVRAAARAEGLGSLATGHGSDVVVIARHDAAWPEFREALLRLSGGACKVAVGGECRAPGDVPRSYREAQLAADLQRASRADVLRFDDLGVYKLLFGAQEQAQMERFVESQLGALLDYDAKKGSELVATLHQYLERGANSEATARALPVHRSTLKYRLKRIREITGAELSCPSTRFNLQLATSAWQTMHCLKGTS